MRRIFESIRSMNIRIRLSKKWREYENSHFLFLESFATEHPEFLCVFCLDVGDKRSHPKRFTPAQNVAGLVAWCRFGRDRWDRCFYNRCYNYVDSTQNKHRMAVHDNDNHRIECCLFLVCMMILRWLLRGYSAIWAEGGKRSRGDTLLFFRNL